MSLKPLRFAVNGYTESTNLQAVGYEGISTLAFSCEDEWYGDSETGFGATVSVTLNVQAVLELQAFLTKWLAMQKEPSK